MKKYFVIAAMALIGYNYSAAQIICVKCFDQDDSISSGVHNMLVNGSFESTNCIPSDSTSTPYSFCPNTIYHICSIDNWTCTGGGPSTYANIQDNGFGMVVDGVHAAYFGNWFCFTCSGTKGDTSCLGSNGCEVTGVPNPSLSSDTAIGFTYGYGGTNGLSLSQTVTGLVPGNDYVLEFWAGGEYGTLPYFTGNGLFAVDIGFGKIFLRDKPTPYPSIGNSVGTRFIVEFKATMAAHTVTFTNWGHICSGCTELLLDDVKLYPLSQLSASVPSCITGFTGNANETDANCNRCNGTATAFPVNGVSPFAYAWNNGHHSKVIDSLCAGSYTVTITDSTGATASATAIVGQGGSTDTLNVFSDKTIMCPGDSAYLCASGGFANYSWNNGKTGQCIYIHSAGNFYVTATDINNCSVESPHTAITVLQSPPTSISISGDTLRVNTVQNVQWYVNGSPIGGATSQTYVTHNSGNYTVLVTDTNGCSTFSNPVTVGINETMNDRVEVYPNPLLSGNWHLETGSSLAGAAAEIFDDNGRLVFKSGPDSYRDRNSTSEIVIPGLTRGVYMLRISTGGGFIFRKLIKL